MNYSFHPAAEAEFLESVGYYESMVPGLGAALIEEFETLAELIGKSPKGWQVELEPDIRRVPLQRFPLSIRLPGKSGRVSGSGCCPQPAAAAVLAWQAVTIGCTATDRRYATAYCRP